jgi:putative endonuclease
MAFVYMLRCADDSTYVGSTHNLEKRLIQHHDGLGASYTRRPGRRPVTLIWSHRCAHIGEAFRLEKQIQGWSRAKRDALVSGEFDLLPGLARKYFGAVSDYYPPIENPDTVQDVE